MSIKKFIKDTRSALSALYSAVTRKSDQPLFAAYELSGKLKEDLEAFQRASGDEFLKSAMKRKKDPNSIPPQNLTDDTYEEAMRDYCTLSNEAYEKTMPDYPQLQPILMSPVIQIRQVGNIYRAYEVKPSVVINNNRMFMISPVGYNGRHAAPADNADVRRLPFKESVTFASSLFGGGWAPSFAVYETKDRGVPIPDDFDPSTHVMTTSPIFYPASDYRFYRASPKVLDMISQRMESAALRDSALRDFFSGIDKIFIDRLIPEGKVAGLSSPDTVNINADLRNRLYISVEEKGSEISYAILNNAFFSVSDAAHGEYIATPNLETEEGRSLHAMIESIPKKTEFLISTACGPMPVEPVIVKSDVGTYVAIPRDEDARLPGSLEVGEAEFAWVLADAEDRRSFITPPPKPDFIIREQKKHSFLFPKGPAI